jgi:N-acetylglucosamine kinase-like BadF-type ATPase
MEVLAVDGGQSAMRVRHSRAPSDVELDGVSRLEGDTVAAVVAAVATGWHAAGSLPTDRAVLGLTTAPSDETSRLQLCEAIASSIGTGEVWLADDAVTGHAGALSLDWGVSVIAGTGVACLAMAPGGPPRIIGGHGYLVGDEGGGFWIGSAGLRAVLQASDGRGPGTALRAPAEEHFDGLEDLGDRLHSSPRPVDAIARFAPAVIDAAGAGDAVATAIVDAAVAELVALVRAALATIGLPEPSVPVALGGRLLFDGSLRARLEETLGRAVPAAAVRSAAGSPLDGAMQLGLLPDPGAYRTSVFLWAARR